MHADGAALRGAAAHQVRELRPVQQVLLAARLIGQLRCSCGHCGAFITQPCGGWLEHSAAGMVLATYATLVLNCNELEIMHANDG